MPPTERITEPMDRNLPAVHVYRHSSCDDRAQTTERTVRPSRLKED
ncbi:Uncharacterised protein [Mycolicibacterium phlei]|jgi:hypothetical protein|nr:hypothetical protein MPHLCCUG_03386 [Mycolicibacterium phlei]STZ20187.1 Uncharacterised protein [Mycolicibacterium phlei]VEG10294.1 Uncharacterised protein [Mycobacteroides chelonae]